MPVDTLYLPSPFDGERPPESWFPCVLRSIMPLFSCARVLSARPANLFQSLVQAASRRSVCSCQPAVMRTQPSQPQSDERSRTRMPRALMPCTNSACTEARSAPAQNLPGLARREFRDREFFLQSIPTATHFRHILANIFLIGQARPASMPAPPRSRCRESRTAAGSASAPAAPASTPNSQTRHSVGLGKCSRDKKVRHLAHVFQKRLAVKLEVGLIHQDRGLGRAAGDQQQILCRRHRARRIIRDSRWRSSRVFGLVV